MAGSGTAHLRAADETLLHAEHLVVEFPVGRSGLKVHAVSDVSLDILEGETLGLVGESGCGKSTTARAMIQLPPPTSGSVVFEGEDLTKLKGEALRKKRPRMQMIFQDPISSLNPRRKIGDLVSEGLDIWSIGDKASRQKRADEVLDAVGLDPDQARGRRPHEFSGGQCQRISIARAVVTEPKLILCDEPVSALDVSVQAQILNLLQDMKARFGLTMVFIAHDLAVVKNVSDRVAVMYLGKLCEIAQPDELYERPVHPYTAALLAAIPEPDPGIRPNERDALTGEIPSPVAPPSGCRFRTRCPKAQQKCAEEEPVIREIRPGHFAACHFPLAEGEQLDFTTGVTEDAAAPAAS
ncbi:MAG TPA: oligopeptide/dipeptide ABC transporter ATP-binding protein [Acidimicrobiia bacterium]|nr:oligopeptide/dipeptide ABC transporter ATP-binding protein [Acidimicrobiia bacterium]